MSGFNLLADHSLTLSAFARKGERVSPVQTRSFTIADVNENGLPDWWEQLYSTTGSLDPEGDDDQDGLNNLREFILGTDPKVRTGPVAKMSHGLPPTLVWPSLTGRMYQIEGSDNLIHWPPIGPPFPGTGGIMTFSEPGLLPDLRMYRLKVSLP